MRLDCVSSCCVCVFLFSKKKKKIYWDPHFTWDTVLSVGPVHCAQDPLPIWPANISQECVTPVGPVHCSRDPQTSFSVTFLLKIGLTALFTHLKIILLQCFQFSVFSKISSIQTDSYFPKLYHLFHLPS